MTRHGECNHCGWCCEHEGQTTAQVANPKGINDPDYYRQRGYVLTHLEGVVVQAHRVVWMRAPCPSHVDERCGIYETRPQTCHNFPVSPKQIAGTPCSYWFEDETGRRI